MLKDAKNDNKDTVCIPLIKRRASSSRQPNGLLPKKPPRNPSKGLTGKAILPIDHEK